MISPSELRASCHRGVNEVYLILIDDSQMNETNVTHLFTCEMTSTCNACPAVCFLVLLVYALKRKRFDIFNGCVFQVMYIM